MSQNSSYVRQNKLVNYGLLITEFISSVHDFRELYTSITKFSGMDSALDKRKMALSTPRWTKKLVNFGPLTKKFTQLVLTRHQPKMNTARAL